MNSELTVRPRIIAGSGRSGTTWILDVLAETNMLRPIFEPLHPEAVPEAATFANRYAAPEEDLPMLREFMERVSRGGLYSWWTDYRIRPHLLVPRPSMLLSPGRASGMATQWKNAFKRYRRFRKTLAVSPTLVKIIRGNLLLSWLRRQLSAQVVFVVRHPGAVVESRLRIAGRSWDPEIALDRFRQPGVLGPIADRYSSLLQERLAPAEAHTLVWCIENQYPMDRAEVDDYPVIFYESLITDGERQWRRVVDALGLQNSPYDNEILKKPSQQAALGRRGAAYAEKRNWYDRLSDEQRRQIERVLLATGVKEYSVYEPAPLITPGPGG